uniref:Uncharacterized protein n=1 Tax=Arundo donax TaxID=35708 RepID=A0A0A8Y0Q0_ARUDO
MAPRQGQLVSCGDM